MEAFRPLYHYTPRYNFMNDPNGLTYWDGQFFLFHQFNPFGNEWGHMSWKQAVSTDLVNWTHLPVALREENGVMIFSGSAVVDTNNTCQLAKDNIPALIALYTGHRPADGQQSQCLAYSTDGGKTWSKLPGNPVIAWEPEFRDPKVFWHEESGRWVMVVVKAAEKKIRIYGSNDLRSWEYLSSFGPEGAPADTIPNWECPDLFPLPIENRPGEFRWVLHISVGNGHPAGGSGSQYFVGHFDGTQFINDNSPAEDGSGDTVLWSDFGKDHYAAITWSDISGPQAEKYWVGWMCNWQYANITPTEPWRNGLALPRLLCLRSTADGLRLIQQPIPALETLRQEPRSFGPLVLSPAAPFTLPDTGVAFEMIAEWDTSDSLSGTAEEFGFRVRVGENEETVIGVDMRNCHVFVDRSRSGVNCSDRFPGRHIAPLPATEGPIRFHIFVDAGSVEVFVNDGLVVLTDLIFPAPESQGFVAYAHGGEAFLKALTLWKLNPATMTYSDDEE